MIGRRIFNYEITEQIGEDAFGCLYKATDRSSGRPVCIKIVYREQHATSKSRKEFKKYTHKLSRLSHPNVAAFYEADGFGTKQVLIFEYIEGQSLEELLSDLEGKEEKISFDKVLNYAFKILNAMEYMHRLKIVHNNIKPENIIITDNDEIKLTNFGPSDFPTTKRGNDRKREKLFPYVSQFAESSGATSKQNDFYAFAIIFFRMLFGSFPFTNAEIEKKHPKELSHCLYKRWDNRVPERMKGIITRSLGLKEDQFYHSANEIKSDLRSLSSQSSTNGQQSRKLRRISKIILYPAIVLSGLAIIMLMLINHEAAVSHLIIVHPFEILESDYGPEMAAFSREAITHDIKDFLTKIENLRIISGMIDTEKIEKEYLSNEKQSGKYHVLRGKISFNKERIKIYIFLSDTALGPPKWSEEYEGEISEVFRIEGHIALDLIKKIGVKIPTRLSSDLTNQEEINPSAYLNYIRGLSHYYRYVREDNEKAIENFSKAIAICPKFSRAYAGLGDSLSQKIIKWDPERKTSIRFFKRAVEVCRKAIELDPSSAFGYKALSIAYFSKGMLKKSLKANLKAIELNPSWSIPYLNTAETYAVIGRYDLSMRYATISIFLDPSPPHAYHQIGNNYMQINNYAKAAVWLEKAIRLNPNFHPSTMLLENLSLIKLFRENRYTEIEKILSAEDASSQYDLLSQHLRAMIAMKNEKYTQAKNILEEIPTYPLPGISSWLLSLNQAHCMLKTDENQEALKIIDAVEKKVKNELDNGSELPDTSLIMSIIQIMRNKKAESYKWLIESVEAGFVDYKFLNYYPLFEPMQKDDEFKLIVKEIAQKIDSMEKEITKLESESEKFQLILNN